MDYEKLAGLSAQAGFTHTGKLSTDAIELKEEVREMCAANSCGVYGKCWSCPPGCGSLTELREKISSYKEGILVQTVGELEDEFDGEGMMETEARHRENLLRLRKLIMDEYPGALILGAGRCNVCKECTFPDAPCRFPESRLSSMEAYGMLVLEVCQKSGMQYYYGKEKIAYTGCVLID